MEFNYSWIGTGGYDRGGYVPGGAGRNKGVRDRRKLREKRRSTGVMHVPSTESTGGSTGEDENNENSQFGAVSSKQAIIGLEFEEKVTISTKPGQRYLLFSVEMSKFDFPLTRLSSFAVNQILMLMMRLTTVVMSELKWWYDNLVFE